MRHSGWNSIMFCQGKEDAWYNFFFYESSRICKTMEIEGRLICSFQGKGWEEERE